MKEIIIFLASFVLLFTSFVVAQEETKTVKSDTLKTINSSQPNSPQAEEGDVKITDGTNILIRITDEGTFGAIEIKTGVPSTTTDKLYNDSGTLKFNGSSLGSGSGATEINDLTDAKYDGASVYLGTGAGTNEVGVSHHNVAIGKDALNNNTQGKHNTATGSGALQKNTTGDANTAVGQLSLFANTTADNNTAIGWQALRDNSTGSSNTATGSAALYNNTAGVSNIATGSDALYYNTTGSYNTAIGKSALYHNTSGEKNTAVGYLANNNNNTNDNNTAIGSEALRFNDSGNNNTAVGNNALWQGSGNDNVAVGFNALYSTDGDGNVGIGRNALYSNIQGSTNIAIGQGSMYYTTNGNNNIGIGFQSNVNNPSGSNNTIIGHLAGGGATNTRDGSVFIGYQAGFDETSNSKLYIENSNSNTPLIWGDFETDSIKINGNLEVTGKTTMNSATIGASGFIISDIVKLEGTFAASVRTISYPNGFNQDNTIVVSYSVKINNGNGPWVSMGYTDDVAMHASLTSSDIELHNPSLSNWGFSRYKIVLMRSND